MNQRRVEGVIGRAMFRGLRCSLAFRRATVYEYLPIALIFQLHEQKHVFALKNRIRTRLGNFGPATSGYRTCSASRD